MTKNQFFQVHEKQTMKAVVTTGYGDFDRLKYRDIPIPKPAADHVLLQVLAAGINHWDIDIRLGTYSDKITKRANAQSGPRHRPGESLNKHSWSNSIQFPIVQGTDCCGRVVSCGLDVDKVILGTRVLVRPCIRTKDSNHAEYSWMGSDFNGAFAQYVSVPAQDAFPIDCNWTDEELATIPYAFGAAENMLERADVSTGEVVLITSETSSIGAAAVQLAKRRHTQVITIPSQSRHDQLRSSSIDQTSDRHTSLISLIGENLIDVVIDTTGGSIFPDILKVLKPSGRYVSCGTNTHPIVPMDLRDIYLKNITMLGCTAWDKPVFQNVVDYIERGDIHPSVCQTFPLEQLIEAQETALQEEHIVKIALIPPSSEF